MRVFEKMNLPARLKDTFLHWGNTFLKHFNLRLVKRYNHFDLQEEGAVLYAMLGIHASHDPAFAYDLPEGIVFSKNRALQLHALLSSFERMSSPAVRLHIIHYGTTQAHLKSYQEVAEIHRDERFHFINQEKGCFRNQLRQILSEIRVKKVFFLVDDILFIRPVDYRLSDGIDPRNSVLSLRHGKHLNRCFTLQEHQPLPIFARDGNDDHFLEWCWNDAEHDWSYVLSVDGHVFCKDEIQLLASSFPFESPNSFEFGMQKYSELFKHRRGLAWPEARIVNIPWNKVQEENDNVFGDIHQDYFLEQWNQGYELDLEKYIGMTNESVHQLCKPFFRKRF